VIWRLQAPRKIHKNVASFLKAKAKNKFLNTNVFSTVKKCKRGMWGKLKGIATLSGWHSLENWRIFQVDTVLKIDASFRLTQSWKLTHLSGRHSLENWRIFQVDTVLKIDATFQSSQFDLKKKNILVIWKYLLFKNVGDFPFSVRRVYANVSFKGF